MASSSPTQGGRPACFGRSACFADGVRGCPRDPASGCQRPRKYGGQGRIVECYAAAFAQVRGYVMGRGETVCKTVGLAYVGSNPTPATTSETACDQGIHGLTAHLTVVALRVMKCHREPLHSSGYGHMADGIGPEPAVQRTACFAGSLIIRPVMRAGGPRRSPVSSIWVTVWHKGGHDGFAPAMTVTTWRGRALQTPLPSLAPTM